MFRLFQAQKSAVRQFSSTSVANSFARAQLLGRIGNELVESEASNGTKYVKYPLAVQAKKDGPVSWFNIISFNESQNKFLTEYVRKGALVHIEATLTQNVFEKDGVRTSAVTFAQNRIDLIQNPKASEEEDAE